MNKAGCAERVLLSQSVYLDYTRRSGKNLSVYVRIDLNSKSVILVGHTLLDS